MNKIYKVVWSKVKNCYVVVSEIAKNVISGSVKSAKVGTAPLIKGAALGAMMAFVITGNVWAAENISVKNYYNKNYDGDKITSSNQSDFANKTGVRFLGGNGKSYTNFYYQINTNPNKVNIDIDVEYTGDAFGFYGKINTNAEQNANGNELNITNNIVTEGNIEIYGAGTTVTGQDINGNEVNLIGVAGESIGLRSKKVVF